MKWVAGDRIQYRGFAQPGNSNDVSLASSLGVSSWGSAQQKHCAMSSPEILYALRISRARDYHDAGEIQSSRCSSTSFQGKVYGKLCLGPPATELGQQLIRNT